MIKAMVSLNESDFNRLRNSMRYFWLVVLIVFSSLTSLRAETARMTVLMNAMEMDGLLDTMHLEHIALADELEAELFPGRGGAEWNKELSALYDPKGMRATLSTEFDGQINEPLYDAALAFFQSDLGQKIVLAENSTREAMLEPEMDAAANDNMMTVAEEDPARFALIEEMVEKGDLIENNVTSGLNANFSFYKGIIDGKGFPYEVSEDEALAETWAGADGMRAETKVWLYSYFTLAYSTLSQDELREYIDFTTSPSGKRLNRVFFDSFDKLFVDLSYATGRAVARRMAGNEI
ncbi:hypothetical protein RB2150_01854 [Rhodobacteraceae bacterium HTCC2150]|nr:hypothetical protein RB2150_01854 [Rhodobacteraceae bacterium HTCC2150]